MAASVFATRVVRFGPTPAFATGPSAELFAVLLGGNEVDSAGNANLGDVNGRGTATVLIRGGTLCYGLLVSTIADLALLARISRNPSGFYVNIHNADFPGGTVRGPPS
jgi:hypothetical protein